MVYNWQTTRTTELLRLLMIKEFEKKYNINVTCFGCRRSDGPIDYYLMQTTLAVLLPLVTERKDITQICKLLRCSGYLLLLIPISLNYCSCSLIILSCTRMAREGILIFVKISWKKAVSSLDRLTVRCDYCASTGIPSQTVNVKKDTIVY